jgi:hypothetical protein
MQNLEKIPSFSNTVISAAAAAASAAAAAAAASKYQEPYKTLFQVEGCTGTVTTQAQA